MCFSSLNDLLSLIITSIIPYMMNGTQNTNETAQEATMTYEEFVQNMTALLEVFLAPKTEPNLPGLVVSEADLAPNSIVNQLANLEEAYPLFAERFENNEGVPAPKSVFYFHTT